MDIVVNQKQISNAEKIQIGKQVKADLIHHLYAGCLPGTMSGVAASLAIFVDFYGYTPTKLLIEWYIAFNLMLLALTLLYFIYTRFRSQFSVEGWEWAYSAVMTGCALLWLPVIYLMPLDNARQFLALIALFLVTTGYGTGSIGQFKLCVVTLSVILVPLIAWCFFKGGIFYNIIGIYSITYFFFMLGANHRSTIWFIDSLKLKLENTLVSYQANHDLLTDLPNQRLLPQYVDLAIHSVKNTEKMFVLLSFSLNRMEMVNDSFGHFAGDSVIQSVATRLLAFAAKASDNQIKYMITISRKDIFNILIVPCNFKEAEDRTKVLFSILDEPFYLEKKAVKMTASIGVSVFPRDGENTPSLVTNADAAMVKAKQFGGNRLEFYSSEINAQKPKQMALETDLHVALKNNEFFLNYQPLIYLPTGEIASMEALIRWRHPVHGLISPVNFIPLAEETGLIVPIGEWVLKTACKQVKLWHEMGFTKLKVAVNLAEKQLRQDNIIDIVKNALATTGFDAAHLELEITETAILDESLIDKIKKFKAMGLSLSVDDFGTGYSGLSYLKRFSIDKLKIDQSFIRDIPGNIDSITIVSAILAMTKEMQICTVAEGVETEEQLNFLKLKGCDYVQGYYFSKPLDTEFFTQLLMKNREKPVYTESLKL